MTDETPNINELLDQLPSFAPGGAISLESIARDCDAFKSELAALDPVRLASTFGGLLLVPELQSSGLRIEGLIHLAIAMARGSKKPSDKTIARLFNRLGEGMIGRLEDPAEDVFVTNIRSPRGNFRVMEGTWEAAGFNLQRAINTLERVPRHEPYGSMRDNVYALLTLSDLMCERAKLARYQLGNQIPSDRLSSKTLAALSSLRRCLRFSQADLAAHQISFEQLGEFGFHHQDRGLLLEQSIGHSTLERYPLIIRNGEASLVLPTAVSSAIRRFIVERMEHYGMRENFVRTLGDEYAELMADTKLLGSYSGAPLRFNRVKGHLIAGIAIESDAGRYLNFIFYLDSLEHFESDGGLTGHHPRAEQRDTLSEAVEMAIDHAYGSCSKQADFRECLTVFVPCGIGRPAHFTPNFKKRENWSLEYVNAADLTTLSRLRDFKDLSLWRLIKAEERISAMGVNLMNINGLLNMVGWSRSLDGHLVPHSDIPEDFGTDDRPLMIMVEQNALRNVRHASCVHWDLHSVQTPEGSWVDVTKEGGSLFKEDANEPMFVAIEDPQPSRWPRGLYETSSRRWWIELERLEGQSTDQAYERFKMLRTWLSRMVPVLEREFSELPEGSIVWRARFNGQVPKRKVKSERDFLSYDQALGSLAVSPDESPYPLLQISADGSFEDALFHPENIAERALVERSLVGFAELCREPLTGDRLAALVNETVPDTAARQSHAFRARKFRDFVQHTMWERPVLVDHEDLALLKIGLGWRVRSRAEGSLVEGKEACTTYLNKLVRMLEDELCSELKLFDRRKTIDFVLNNHESAIKDRDNWRRTAAAVLALHNDQEATLATIADHDSDLNGVFQTSRLLVEFAICECPLAGGRRPGRLDMSELMAKMALLTSLGGWSDAIRWDAMEPRLRITPLGDVHANMSFREEILAPYVRVGSDLTVKNNVDNYADNVRDPEVIEDGPGRMPEDFRSAFEEQFGASVAAIRGFADCVEDIGIKRDTPIFSMRRSQLIDEAAEFAKVEPSEISSLLENLTFKTRAEWRTVPAGFEERDRFPWRFRRRLSMLRLPLLILDDAADPEILIAPGIVRDAISYMTHNYHHGDFPLRQLSPKMKKWAGASRDKLGHDFSVEVSDKLVSLGWKTEIEVPVRKMLQQKFPIDYGDVDVLAWRPETGRVLLLECKHVQHRKTEGEIAEQLADFRGDVGPDGKPDLLLRHMRRATVISEHATAVAKYVGITDPKIEGHLVFKNPVPMKFAWSQMEKKMPLHIFSDLDRL